jgi:hypothetical protein
MTRRFQAGLLETAGLLCTLLAGGSLHAQYGGNGGGCASCGLAPACSACRENCPPKVVHYYEGPPRLKFKKACPRPLCDPCHLPHFGYYQTCWAPWPFPPDWSHCPVPPPGAAIPPPPVPPFTPRTRLPDRDTYRDLDRVPSDRGPYTPPAPLKEQKPDVELPPPKPLPDKKPMPKPEEKPMVRLID